MLERIGSWSVFLREEIGSCRTVHVQVHTMGNASRLCMKTVIALFHFPDARTVLVLSLMEPMEPTLSPQSSYPTLLLADLLEILVVSRKLMIVLERFLLACTLMDRAHFS